MIEFRGGDILKDDSEALVNTVNCVGVMGRGIALQFKNAWPENFVAYEKACKNGEVQPGRMLVVTTGALTGPRLIINFPTKRHWRGKSRLEDIDAGLADLVEVIKARGIRSIAVPPLGAGLGGLDWNEVRPRIEAALSELPDVHVRVYEPYGAPTSDVMTHRRAVPAMTPGRAALIGLMDRYLGGLMDPEVTLLEVHKLMYFMQKAGEPLRLNFQKARFGPYAQNLRHVLKTIEGHFTIGYGDGGDRPDKPLALIPGAATDAAAFLAEHPTTRDRFERVAKLVDGFESPFGLELLATVHWLIAQDDVRSEEALVQRIYAWNTRKKQFTRRQLVIAADVLAKGGWVAPFETVAVGGLSDDNVHAAQRRIS